MKPWELAGGPAELTFGELHELLDQLSDIELRQSFAVPARPEGA